MINLYLLWIFLTGFAFSSLLGGTKSTLSLKLALTPALGAFLPILILHILHLLGLRLTTVSLWTAWTLLGVPLVLGNRKHLISLWKDFLSLVREGSIWQRTFYLLLILALWALLLRVAFSPIWPGDGMGFWGRRAWEWVNQGSLGLSADFIQKYHTWNSYPLLHSLGMAVNILAYPLMPPAYSMNIFDGLYMIGLFTSSLFFLDLFELSRGEKALGAIMISFAQREMPGLMISGYAEIDIAYFSFLSFTLLLHFLLAQDQAHVRLPPALGIILGCLVTSKAEGLNRALMVIFVFLLLALYHRQKLKDWINWKRDLSITLLLALLPIFLDKFNHPIKDYFSPYYHHLVLVPEKIILKIPKVVMGLFHSFVPENKNIFKWNWPWTIGLALAGFAFRQRFQRELKKGVFIPGLFEALGLLVFLNLAFNVMPGLLVENVVDPRLDDPRVWAQLVLWRIHLHWAPFLNALAVLSLFYFFKGKFMVPPPRPLRDGTGSRKTLFPSGRR